MSSPICIPESVSLAIHALARLAAGGDEAVKLGDLLIRPGSADHLSKVMQKLARAGMVRSKRGRGGGFTLAANPSDVRLMDVWIAMEGTFQSGICPFAGKGCPLPQCIFSSMAADAAGVVSDYFTATTFADLAKLFSGDER